MGVFDNLRNLFKGSESVPDVSETKEDDSYRKAVLARQIVSLVDQIKRVNSFDSSLWNLSNVSSYELERRSLAELEKMHSSLSSRLSELTRKSQTIDQKREPLEEAKWTGRKPKDLTDREFDRLQRDEER